MQPANYLLTVELSSELYADLREKAQTTGQTESELVIQCLRQVLGLPESAPTAQQNSQSSEQERFSALEVKLEQRLKEYVEKLVNDRVSLSSLEYPSKQQVAFEDNPPNFEQKLNVNLDVKPSMPMPTIRPLQVGDRVLVLESDSPYYMAKLLVIKTSLIRATVETETGEKTFLKRDLRFVEATQEPNNC
ncbi:hypothetical protein [Pseudanabaena sp. FACHB-1998]|uniref:hypothetical protein n=1 Tax=Pseudanabaena sp. FACHB-1998 TaxID=2692858 RepID=UPI00168131F1|nr:hypothetical protein [Pseudanabaena sp. FACHB-1998]